MSANGNTNTRTALKLAIGDMIAKSTDPRAVKAIVLLTDGAYNQDGKSLARATGSYYIQKYEFSGSDGTMEWYKFSDLLTAEQNMAYYASEHNIKVYVVTFGTDT